MKINIYQHWWNPNIYYAQVLDSKYPHAYGQGNTPELAVTSLKIRINQLRNK